MPACPNGASLAPDAPDQVWLDKVLFLSDISGEIIRVAPWAWAQYADELHNTADICAQNRDPPLPLTPEDIIKGTAMFPFGGLYGINPVLKYLADYAKYAAFLRNCVCNGPPPPSGLMCPYQGFSGFLPSGGSTAPVPYDIPQSVYDTWPVTGILPNQDWKPVWEATIAADNFPNEQHLMQWSTDQTTWHSFWEVSQIHLDAPGCHASALFVQPPRMPRTGFVRLHSTSGVSWTFSGLNFCFCAVTSTPPPNNPPDTAPTPPAPAPTGCTTDDICTAINELNRRLNFLSAEISDLLAAGGTQTLTTLATQPISGEGRATLAVGTRAVHVALATLPPTTGKQTLANPDELHDLGSLRYFDGAGYTRREIIDAQDFTSSRTTGALEVTWALAPTITGTLSMLG